MEEGTSECIQTAKYTIHITEVMAKIVLARAHPHYTCLRHFSTNELKNNGAGYPDFVPSEGSYFKLLNFGELKMACWKV